MTNNAVIMQVAYDSGMTFIATTPDQKGIAVEPSPALGGSGKNPNPIDYLVASLWSCTGIKVFTGLSARDARLDTLRITIEGRRRDRPPLVFENLHVTFFLTGYLDDETVKTTINETMTLTCPVAVMLGKATELTWDYQIGS